MSAALNMFLDELGVSAELLESLTGIARLVPEQILSSHVGVARAALVDPFGRVHKLQAESMIGREPKAAGLVILDGSVSRQHARITKRGDSYFIADLASTNGTSVNDELVTREMELRSGDVVHVGQVGFLFLQTESPIPDLLPINRSAVETFPTTRPPTAALDDDEPDESTYIGPPLLPLQLVSPSGGGGGLLTLGSVTVQLTLNQYELLSTLVDRMRSEAGLDASIRGFVRSSELMVCVSWDTRQPDENHLKQLVRRLRRTLARESIDNLIESRRGFGYRLRLVPEG
ncbi:MAG: FHA domain-containing protein [Deltaproteobacteria bacterium]|nr:FHA domain-containing protein [Deltaproteobacteria bacterium]